MTETSVIESDARSYRLSNIDMLRGLVIIIMAIDHVRDFFYVGGLQDPMNNPEITTGLYLTRWITHFCAPVFVLLAGTSIGLMEARKSKKELSAFVFKRGLWLIFVEFIILSTILTFTPFGDPIFGGLKQVGLQVIWALGVSMVVLSGAIFLGPRTCLLMGGAIILFGNLLEPIWPAGSFDAPTTDYWIGLYAQTTHAIPPFFVFVAYAPLPWIGMMLIGYGSAYIFQKPPVKRDAYLTKLGVIFTVAFFIIRFTNIYGDPNLWQVQPLGILATIFDFMNVTKYPASLLFFLITVGPMAIVCAFADKWSGWLKDMLVMFGRVPFAFYVAHFFLIHVLSVIYGVATGFEMADMMHFFIFYPEGYGSGLGMVYLVWLVVIATLYPFCKWMVNLKKRRKDWWLSYL